MRGRGLDSLDEKEDKAKEITTDTDMILIVTRGSG